MANYPIKLLKDEQGTPFVPLVSSDSIQMATGEKLADLLDDKVSHDDLVAGQYIEIETDGGKTTISVDLPASINTINNLTTESSGQGALDAYQGKVLKDSIPVLVDALNSTDANKALSARQGKILSDKVEEVSEKIPGVINNLTTTDTDNALSAYQGYLLNRRVVPEGGTTGQVLKKSSNSDHALEWGDAADPNAIVGDGSIMSIVELTYEEYQALEKAGELDETTEYHVSDWNENERTYLTTEDIQGMIDEKTDTKQDLKYFTKIEANTDLNDYTEPGTYRAMSYANYTSTLANVPVGLGTGFTLNVMQYTSDITNTSYRRQELIARERTFVRYTTDGGENWSDWFIMSSYGIGDILITSTNTDPSKRYGGSWELVNKEFAEANFAFTEEHCTLNTDLVSAISGTLIRTGHTIRLLGNWTTAATIGDDSNLLWTFHLDDMGVNQFGFVNRFSHFSDGGQVAIEYYSTSNGELQSRDIMRRGSDTADLPAGVGVSFQFVWHVFSDFMLDDACDKFYWKRTA